MTFITAPTLTTNGTPIINTKPREHLVDVCEVHGAEPHVIGGPPSPAHARFLLLMMLSVMVAFGALIIFMPMDAKDRPIRYHGYCTIPIKVDGEESNLVSMRVRPDYNVMPLRWSQDDVDLQQLFRVNNPTRETEELVRTLRERFDIGDQVEKISVIDNGKRVNFIHDFEQNTTDIEDTDRCFTSALDREAVLPPSLLMLSIEDGAVFDISRIRSALAAELPALTADAMAPALREACMEKPVYRLVRQEFNIIRKRAVDAPAHDYIQFSGRGIQEIEISNLAEILQHEQDIAIAQR